MKPRSPRKLTLARETIRILSDRALRGVASGDPSPSWRTSSNTELLTIYETSARCTDRTVTC